MRVALPSKNSTPTLRSIAQLENGLTSVISGHALADEPWTFYEVLDEYLGPWGQSGYPIAYGKHYCIVFNSDQNLQRDAQGREWIERTTILLQEMLRDYVVSKFRARTLPRLTEAELRSFAFESHPTAYVQGGLAWVVTLSPGLLPTIASIPGAEFAPDSPNFRATVKQVFVAGGMTAFTTAALGLAVLMPAHSGFFARAAAEDRRRSYELEHEGISVSTVLMAIRNGRADRVQVLNEMIRRLSEQRFYSPQVRRMAAEAIALARARRERVCARYREELARRPDLKRLYDRADPGWDVDP